MCFVGIGRFFYLPNYVGGNHDDIITPRKLIQEESQMDFRRQQSMHRDADQVGALQCPVEKTVYGRLYYPNQGDL